MTKVEWHQLDQSMTTAVLAAAAGAGFDTIVWDVQSEEQAQQASKYKGRVLCVSVKHPDDVKVVADG